MAIEKKNILFVCRYNRFRSRIAEAYFNKINKNKNIEAKSAGLFRGSPLSQKIIKIAKEFGLNINGKVEGLSTNLMVWQDMTIVIADDVPKTVFNENKKYNKKVIIWKIKDDKEENATQIKKLIQQIMKQVDKLNFNLERKNDN